MALRRAEGDLGRMTAHSTSTLRTGAILLLGFAPTLGAQAPGIPQSPKDRAGPIIVDGMTQVVPAFADSAAWIRENLWVETDFDSDRDGRRDRMHVAVTRPRQTQS